MPGTLRVGGELTLRQGIEGVQGGLQQLLIIQEAKADALQDRIDHHGGAGGLQIVALGLCMVDDLIEEAGFRIGPAQDAPDRLPEEIDQGAVMLIELLVHIINAVHEGHEIPAHGAEPEIGAAAGFRIGPELLTVQIAGVIIEPLVRIIKIFADVAELGGDVRSALQAAEAGVIGGAEGLGHVQPIQPDLLRINLLVPEVAAGAAGMGGQTVNQKINRLAVPFIAGLIQGEEEDAAAVGGIDVVLVQRVIGDDALGGDHLLQIAENEIPIRGIARCLEKIRAADEHAAVLIIPVGLIGLIGGEILANEGLNILRAGKGSGFRHGSAPFFYSAAARRTRYSRAAAALSGVVSSRVMGRSRCFAKARRRSYRMRPVPQAMETGRKAPASSR